jgi:hypothetical protein
MAPSVALAQITYLLLNAEPKRHPPLLGRLLRMEEVIPSMERAERRFRSRSLSFAKPLRQAEFANFPTTDVYHMRSMDRLTTILGVARLDLG